MVLRMGNVVPVGEGSREWLEEVREISLAWYVLIAVLHYWGSNICLYR